MRAREKEVIISHMSDESKPLNQVAILVLNWNGWRDTLECLESVQQLTYSSYLTVVVDNGSQDDSVERIKSWAQEKLREGHVLVEYTRTRALEGGEEEREEALERASPKGRMVLIRNQENLGFAEGNNVAIHYVLRKKRPADYVFLLNNDAKIEKDCVTHLVGVDQKADAGIVGGFVMDGTGRHIQFAGRAPLIRQFFSPLVRWHLPPPETENGFWSSFFVSGTGMLIRRDVLTAVSSSMGQYLDGAFFMYGEVLDFCARAHKAGFRSVIAQGGVVYHKGAHTSGGLRNPIVYYYPLRNRILLANKLLPSRWKVLFHLANLLVCLGLVLKNLISQRTNSARAIVSAQIDGYRGVTGKWKRHEEEVLRYGKV